MDDLEKTLRRLFGKNWRRFYAEGVANQQSQHAEWHAKMQAMFGGGLAQAMFGGGSAQDTSQTKQYGLCRHLLIRANCRVCSYATIDDVFRDMGFGQATATETVLDPNRIRAEPGDIDLVEIEPGIYGRK
jgi:hypothetical protein